MFKLLVLWIISLSLCECLTSKLTPEYFWENLPGGNEIIRLSIHSEKNKNDEWIDNFAARKEYSKSSVTEDIGIKYNVSERDGQRIVYIEGPANASTSSTAKDPLRFHAKCGWNIVILDEGRAAEKDSIYPMYGNQVFTKRSLRDNEIFEVRLNKMITNTFIAIGVVTESPDTVHILDDMRNSPVAFILYDRSVYTNRAIIHHNYRSDLANPQEGGTAGVMRTKSGTLHFFINGVDQGPAVSNIPSPVYGFVDFLTGVKKVSIVD